MPPDRLLAALARLLRPLVQLQIRSGVTFPVFADLLRALYVEVARDDLLTDPRSRTDSRISLMTGIHRKELRRQRSPGAEQEPPVVTLNSQLLALWLGSPDYTDAAGRPLALPRSGPAPSFDSLVAAVTRDLRPRAVLDDWIAQGMVTSDAEGRVVLKAEAYLPREGSEAQLFYFARNLHDHVAAAAANVAAAGPPPFLDRSVHYDRLGPEAAAALEALAREAAQRLLVEVNRQALAIAEEDEKAAAVDPARPTRRVNLGVYLYAEDDAPDAPKA
ncbi:hypothetical protein GXW74_00535 [Roseomonas eburnea]|uniref:Uncharacterized protein n=1 Tax=Neoroseomonas eburnea TaxID=1346889 RepID=A0A9X9X5H6_9PROT|nr:DUF6502 family protein [Neoroseomonas eburnea]MBR0678962.1 hypothetical protein [Neoroseomonas eburnea]